MRIPLLLGLLLLGIFLSSLLMEGFLASSAVTLDRQLVKLEGHMVQGNTAEAAALLQNLQRLWRRTEPRWSLLTDHREIDEIELALVRLASYLQHQDAAALAELAAVRRLVRHIPQGKTDLGEYPVNPRFDCMPNRKVVKTDGILKPPRTSGIMRIRNCCKPRQPQERILPGRILGVFCGSKGNWWRALTPSPNSPRPSPSSVRPAWVRRVPTTNRGGSSPGSWRRRDWPLFPAADRV